MSKRPWHGICTCLFSPSVKKLPTFALKKASFRDESIFSPIGWATTRKNISGMESKDSLSLAHSPIRNHKKNSLANWWPQRSCEDYGTWRCLYYHIGFSEPLWLTNGHTCNIEATRKEFTKGCAAAAFKWLACRKFGVSLDKPSCNGEYAALMLDDLRNNFISSQKAIQQITPKELWMRMECQNPKCSAKSHNDQASVSMAFFDYENRPK